MLSGGQCFKCASGLPCNMCSTCDARPLVALADYKFSSDILIIKNRKNLKGPTHFCKICGYGDFSSTRVRRHLLLRHHFGSKFESAEKPSILADRLSQTNHQHRHSDSEPESPMSQKMCEDQDLPEDLSVHSDHSASDNDENVQVVPQFKPAPAAAAKIENKRSVIVRPPKKTAAKRAAPAAATSILKRRLLGEQFVDELEASEATLNANELNVKMVYQNSKFVIDKSEAFWLKGYNLPPRYELAQ